MDFFSIVIIVVGLALFEAVSSIDNAIINADVLSTMGAKARRFFVTWGILIAVFLVRGLLPWVIVWATVPSLGFIGSFTAMFSDDPNVHGAIEAAAPILLMGGVVGRLFREFAVTLAVAIGVSAVLSLTLTPVLSYYLLPKARLMGH